MVAIVREGKSTEETFAQRKGLIFVSCNSHRCNLAVENILFDHADTINKVQELRQKLPLQLLAEI